MSSVFAPSQTREPRHRAACGSRLGVRTDRRPRPKRAALSFWTCRAPDLRRGDPERGKGEAGRAAPAVRAGSKPASSRTRRRPQMRGPGDLADGRAMRNGVRPRFRRAGPGIRLAHRAILRSGRSGRRAILAPDGPGSAKLRAPKLPPPRLSPGFPEAQGWRRVRPGANRADFPQRTRTPRGRGPRLIPPAVKPTRRLFLPRPLSPNGAPSASPVLGRLFPRRAGTFCAARSLTDP
jgi:hypothetical protein